MTLIFFAENFTEQFMCGHALRLVTLDPLPR